MKYRSQRCGGDEHRSWKKRRVLAHHQEGRVHSLLMNFLKRVIGAGGERVSVQSQAHLWIRIWEELHKLVIRGILVEVELVKAHRTKKEKEKMTHFERFVTEGNEKADDRCRTKDSWRKQEQRQMQQEREEAHAALQYAASFHCLVEQWKDCEELRPKPKVKWVFVDKERENTEQCAEADRYRCMRCGRGSEYVKMPGKCTGPKFLSKKCGKMGKTAFGRP